MSMGLIAVWNLFFALFLLWFSKFPTKTGKYYINKKQENKVNVIILVH